MFFKLKQMVIFSFLFFFISCGESEDSPLPGVSDGEKNLLSPIEQSVREASKQYEIPERFLLATGYVETRLQPEELSFRLTDSSFDFPQGSSAFAISRSELGIGEDSAQDRLGSQVKAYAKWLSEKLKSKVLVKDPKSAQEKFDWIWEIASLHRQGEVHKYTERSVFSQELIEVLNEGFYWFDSESRQSRHFAPEKEKIETKAFDDKSKGLMVIEMRQSQVDYAKKVFLSTSPLDRPEVSPKGIEILHCPFSLSVCLDMQTNNELMEEVNGWTHYMIPSDDLITDMSLQVRNHHLVLDPKALEDEKKHKIRIMLTGNSGRAVNGSRKLAYGNWLTHWQLEKLEELTHELCFQMVNDPKEDSFSTMKECLSPEDKVIFRTSGLLKAETWFSIPDFDPDIFHHYIGEREDSITGNLSVKNASEEHEAGSDINFLYKFSKEIRYIEKQELLRCPGTSSDRLIWHDAELIGVSGLTEKEEQQKLWSWGPNKDGVHFFRAKFYDEEGKLVAWDYKTVRLKNFEEKDNLVLAKKCG